MKKLLTKKPWLLLMVCLSVIKGYSQTETNTEFNTRMNYVFNLLEKNRVPTGLLLDRAFEFAELKSYNGVLTDSNKVNAGLLKDIYTTVVMSAIHTNAGSFYHPDYIDSIWQLQRQPGIITLSGVYYNYSRFKDNAVTGNLLTVTNDQFKGKYVSGVWQNPYQTETLFAMSPALHFYSGRAMQVKLPSNLWLTNNAPAVSNLAVDLGTGSGYQTITQNQLVNISYTETGTKVWKFRLTLTNGSQLFSHTDMQVLPEPNKPYNGNGGTGSRFSGNNWTPQPLTADNPYLGQLGQGWITVDYANADLRLRRPLIVAEGFDPAHLIAPELQFGFTTFFTFLDQIAGPAAPPSQLRDLLQSVTQQYDIIYVDWARGTDHLQRNALLLERVIRWVNEQKVIDGSNEPNVVLGQSMGGVIARWALRDMENRGLNHQTRLFVSWDAPHLGANIPLAYQHAARHINNLFVQSAVPLLLGGSNTIRIVRNALNLMDVPAARQMLYNRTLNNGTLDNTEHNTWQTELRNLGYPQLSRNVAVSNGSECGIDQGFNQMQTWLI